jgi:hypothetical protein
MTKDRSGSEPSKGATRSPTMAAPAQHSIGHLIANRLPAPNQHQSSRRKRAKQRPYVAWPYSGSLTHRQPFSSLQTGRTTLASAAWDNSEASLISWRWKSSGVDGQPGVGETSVTAEPSPPASRAVMFPL